MAAAEHGATFPKAQALRGQMTLGQLHDFAATPEVGLPRRVQSPGTKSHPARNLGSYHHPKGGYRK